MFGGRNGVYVCSFVSLSVYVGYVSSCVFMYVCMLLFAYVSVYIFILTCMYTSGSMGHFQYLFVFIGCV